MAEGPVATGRRRVREAAFGYLLLLPALCIFGVFAFYPFLRNFKLALYRTPPYPNEPSHYVGLHQVGQVLSSSTFLQSLGTTVLFVVMVVPAGVLLGLFLAVAAHRRLRGLAVYRIVFSSPVVTSAAVAALIFDSLMSPTVGLLPWLGINPHPSMLASPTWALPAIAIIAVWGFTGLSFIIMSAGLQSVPEEVLEAARVDGTSSWTVFWRITVPLLSPTIFFGVVAATIYAFQTFAQIDILIPRTTVPVVHTDVLLYNIFTTLQAATPNAGKAAVMSIALFVITLLVALVQIRLLERRVEYGN